MEKNQPSRPLTAAGRTSLASARAALLPGLAIIGALSAQPAFAGCGAAGCGVNTEQEVQALDEGLVTRLDLRYENSNQDQPRFGSSAVGFGQVRRHHDERRTLGQQLRLGVDVALDKAWGISAQLPVTLDRTHDHVHNHHGTAYADRWSLSGLGDLRLLGRYQLPRDASRGSWGFRFGLKLPTGATGRSNAEGLVAERSLQVGTGSTDAVLGAYYTQSLGGGHAWFASVTGQQALWSQGGFQPGHALSLDLGYRHRLDERWSAYLQSNVMLQGQDHGVEAEPSSGCTCVSLSPGLGLALSKQAQAYVFAQVPVWQRVNDVQLSRPLSVTAGVTVRL